MKGFINVDADTVSKSEIQLSIPRRPPVVIKLSQGPLVLSQITDFLRYLGLSVRALQDPTGSLVQMQRSVTEARRCLEQALTCFAETADDFGKLKLDSEVRRVPGSAI